MPVRSLYLSIRDDTWCKSREVFGNRKSAVSEFFCYGKIA